MRNAIIWILNLDEEYIKKSNFKFFLNFLFYFANKIRFLLTVINTNKSQSLNELYNKVKVWRMEGYSQQLKDQSRALSRYSKDKKNILEVGFNAGHSSETFLLSNDVSNITSVDIGEHFYYKIGYYFLKKKFSNRIKLIVEDSLTALEKLNESGNVYDLIFVDGNHSYEYAKKDLLNSRNLSDKNTIILMDDVNGQDVKRAWNELIQDKLLEEIEIIEFDLTQNVRYVRAMGAGRFLFDEK